jgi:hypothetical protein
MVLIICLFFSLTFFFRVYVLIILIFCVVVVLFSVRYLIECRHSATNKAPFPRACHRWYQSHLLEPVTGDLDCSTRVVFRVRTPLATDVALLMGDSWYHFRQTQDHVWEASVVTSPNPCAAKLYARLHRDTSRFSPLLEFQIVQPT